MYPPQELVPPYKVGAPLWEILDPPLIMVQNHVSINIIQNGIVRIYTSYIKFNTLVFLSFSLCYAFCIPFAPLLFQDGLTLLHHTHVWVCAYLHMALEYLRIQVSKNTIVNLFELHGYYCILYYMSNYIHVISFCLTHVKYKIIMYHNLLYLLG